MIEIDCFCYIDKQMLHRNMLTFMTAKLDLQNYVLWVFYNY